MCGAQTAPGAPLMFDGPAAPAGPARIDVMFCYNQGMLSVGNSSVIRMVAQVMVNQANACMANSRVDVSFRIVGFEQVDYAQASRTDVTAADLEAFSTGPAFAAARSRRSQLGADLYCLMLNLDVPLGARFVGGIAHIANRLEPAQGYSVVAYNALSANVFAHEAGHNLGCQHESGEALYPYAHGYRRPGRFATVMAYPQPGERSIPYYSNPAVTFQGEPVGLAEVADEARALRQSGPAVAGYAAATVPLASPTPAPTPLTIELRPGWNAVGFARERVTIVEGSAVAGVMTFNGTEYVLGSLAEIDTRRGCWLYAREATTLRYLGGGDPQGNFLQLERGWNLVNFPGSVDGLTLPADVLPQLYEAASGTVVGLGEVRAGRAYWLYAASANLVTWP